jgi:hypothetical protein
MPDARQQLRAARLRDHLHRETTTPPMPAASTTELAYTGAWSCITVIEPTRDGMATWRYRLPPGARVRGPDPGVGGGQFWIVLSGSASAGEAAFLPPNSCVFVAPDDGALTVVAGNGGAEALCLQFPVLARH